MTVNFVAIDARVDRTDGVDDVATGQMKDRAARWAAFALWLVIGLLTTSTVRLRILTRTGAFGEPWHLAALGDLAAFMLPTVGLVIYAKYLLRTHGEVLANGPERARCRCVMPGGAEGT
jgi:hypothetical protein